MPSRDRTRQLRDVSVVLQPYHELCQSGGFADYFPGADRFVYFNPAAVPAAVLAEEPGNIPTRGHDSRWNLELLDLGRAEARRFAIAQGRKALGTDGVHGLFVDDLDRWDGSAVRRHARAVLHDCLTGRSAPAAWFVNRGFGFWKQLPGMTAVLLEDLTPYHVDRMAPSDVSWVRTAVLRPLLRLRARGTAAYSLTYDPAASAWQPLSPVARALADLVGPPLLAPLHLDRWPDELTEEN